MCGHGVKEMNAPLDVDAEPHLKDHIKGRVFLTGLRMDDMAKRQLYMLRRCHFFRYSASKQVTNSYCSDSSTTDQLWYVTTIYYWGILEAGLCIIAACLPTLGPLFLPKRIPANKSISSFSFTSRLRRVWQYLRALTGRVTQSRRKQPEQQVDERFSAPVSESYPAYPTGSNSSSELVTQRTQAQAFPVRNLESLSDQEADMQRCDDIEYGNIVVTRELMLQGDRM